MKDQAGTRGFDRRDAARMLARGVGLSAIGGMTLFSRRCAALVFMIFVGFGTVETAQAAEELALNLVWTRVADVNGELGSVESVEFSPDGRFIVSGSKFDNQIIMWRTSDGAEIWRRDAGEEIERVGWSPDGQWVAAAAENREVQIYSAADGARGKTLVHANGIDALVWSHGGRWLATGEESGDGGVTGYIRVFAAPELEEVAVLDHGGTINELAFNPDDSRLASAGHDGELRIWRTEDFSQERLLIADSARHLVTVDISPNGELVAAAGFGGAIYLWRLADGKLLKTFNSTGKKIETVKWMPDGEYLLTAGHDPRIFIYRLNDILTREEVPVAYMSLPFDYMEYLHVHPLGSMIASAHQDGMIRLWVYMSEDPTVNEWRHRWVMERQEDVLKEVDEEP